METNPTEDRTITFNWKTLTLFLLFLLFASLYTFSVLTAPPNELTHERFEIMSGSSASSVVDQLHELELIRSEFVFYIILLTNYDPSSIKAGVYVLNRPYGMFELAELITGSAPPQTARRVTLPEGFTIEEMATIAESDALVAEEYIASAEGKEGYLFPDTYLITPDTTAAELVTLQEQTFLDRIAELEADIAAHPLSLDEIVILASILEKEGKSDESMRVISGILQNRLAIDMPLQADATIGYVLDKPLSELSADDLDIESPYNTYLNRGLPPTPIGNPGIRTIESVLDPLENENFYYITGNDGIFYYAETYEQHLQNIERYLRN